MNTTRAILAMSLAAGLALAQASAGRASLPEGVKALRDLAYVENGHERHKLDLYLPEKAEGLLPLVIWIHGGGWQNGSKEGCPPARQGYLARGYAVASLNYRLSGHAVFPAQIEDCKAAIRWLRVHANEYGIDPDRFGVWGSSAGGHLVALLGTSVGEKRFDVGANLGVSSRVQAVCDYYGPSDLTQMDAHAVPGARLKHDLPDSPEAKLIGGAVQENKEKAARASPLTYVTTNMPPFLIVHGDADPTVPFHQSELLFDALQKAGGTVHLHCIKGAGHGRGFGGKEIGERVNAFFDRWLKNAAVKAAAPEATRTESQATEPAGGQGQGRGRPGLAGGVPEQRPRLTFEQVLAREDADKDGRVTKAEFKGPQPLFQRLDRDGDGVLAKPDFETP